MPKPGNAGGGGGGKGAATPPAGALVGTEDAEIFSGTGLDDVIWTLGGDDQVFGLDGNDTIEAGAGNDTIDGGDGNDVLNGGDGADLFIGSAGSDTIDGGGGNNQVLYFAEDEADYTITAITEIQGNGKKAQEVIVGYEVAANDGSGDIDYITNANVVVQVLPPVGAITTQGDFATVDRDGTVTINVLDNDYIEGGNLGEGLTLTALSDIQLDVDGDGFWDTDLIDEAQPLSYYEFGGLLNDGSLLTVSTDGTMTWDPNDVYDIDPGTTPVVSFWYEATDGVSTEYGDVTFAVSYPAPVGDIDFETMTPTYDPFMESLLGYNFYNDGPDGSYVVTQLTNATNWFELRDVDAAGDYDYDDDGDDEFRVWTDTDGTTHELNIAHELQNAFDLGGMTISGLDAGEVANFYFADATGTVLGTASVTADDLTVDDVIEFIGATGVTQVSIEAGNPDDEFFIDDIFFL